MNTSTALALTAALTGCACLHLASPNQRWRLAPLPSRPAQGAGLALLVMSWLGLRQDMQTITATFTLASMLMLIFVLLPYLGAFIAMKRDR